MFKGQLLFVLLIVYICESSCALDDVYDIGKAVWRLYLIIDKITSNDPNAMDELPNDNVINEEIRNRMDEIHKQLDPMEEFMYPKIIHDLVKSWPDSIMLYKCIDTLEIYISSIDEYYKDFRRHMNETSYPSEELEEFIKSISSNIDNSIRMIRSYVMNGKDLLPGHRNLIYAITGNAAFLPSELCNSPQILSHVLVQLFKMIIIAEVKGHVMFAIATMYQLTQTAGVVNIYTKEQFEVQFRAHLDLFASNIPLADAVYVRACDPIDNNWIRGKSFYEFEGTFQTGIFHYNSIDCAHDSCNDVQSERAEQCDLQYYDNRSGCLRITNDCIYLDAVRACVLNSGAHRFQYVNSSGFGLLGTNSECPQDSGYIIEGGISWNSTEGVCACKCYGNDNKIGLFMTQSRVESNMVIIGLRFVRKDQMLYIQPREGKLDADGRILPLSERWIRIPKNIPSSQIHSIDEQNKLFFFDDVRLPASFALIGIKFTNVKREHLMGFAIEIYGAPFDYRSGKLNLDPKSFIAIQPPNEVLGEPLSFKAISSVYAHSTQSLSPVNKKYVLLERSELEEDFGQSTLPLFDGVLVTTNPPSVLGGIGIFHKGIAGYAGFISLRIYGVKYAEYFTNFVSSYIDYYNGNNTVRPTN